MEDRPLHVHMLAISARKQVEHEQVHKETKSGDDEHRPGEHLRGISKALIGFDEDPKDDPKERERVDEARDYLESEITKGAFPVGFAAAETEGRIGEPQRDRIREHMPGVGDEGERAGDVAADGLDEHEGEDQKERDEDLALVVPVHLGCVRMRIVMVVVVVVSLSHRLCYVYINRFL